MNSLPFLTDHIMRKYNKVKDNKKHAPNGLSKPGSESIRDDREAMTL